MSKNSKNILQEYFQQKQLSLPIYDTKRTGGSDHNPSWLSVITINDGKKFTGHISQTKIAAEISAAGIVLDYINTRQEEIKSQTKVANLNKVSVSKVVNSIPQIVTGLYQPENYNSIVPPILTNIDVHSKELTTLDTETFKSTVILVDVENLPKFIDEIKDRVNEFVIYAFVGEHHCLSDKIFPESVIKILSPSTRPDGSDTCMQVYTGVMLACEMFDNYIIATRDHFGSTLVEMISTSGLGWKNKNARLVSKPSQL